MYLEIATCAAHSQITISYTLILAQPGSKVNSFFIKKLIFINLTGNYLIKKCCQNYNIYTILPKCQLQKYTAFPLSKPNLKPQGITTSTSPNFISTHKLSQYFRHPEQITTPGNHTLHVQIKLKQPPHTPSEVNTHNSRDHHTHNPQDHPS